MNALLLLAEASGGGGTIAQVARTFGVDWPHLIAQTISFGIVCIVLYRYAYKPVLKILEQRSNLIAQGLADAEKSKAELAETEAQRRAVMAEANARINQMIEEAHAAAARVQERETERARAAVDEMLAKAREDAGREHARMLIELKREVGQLVIQTTAKVTGKVLTPEDQRRLSDETAMQVNAS